MNIFNRKKEEGYEEDEELDLKDIRSESRKNSGDSAVKRKKKEVQKPWSKRERYIVLAFFLSTILVSSMLSASSRNWKLPGFPQLKLPNFKEWNWDFWGSEVITVGPGKSTLDPYEVERDKKITAEFNQITRDLSGVYSIYVINLGSGYAFGVGETETFTAASLIKLPVIAAIYMEAAEGQIELDEKPKGSNFTFRELAREMGKKSNNEAQTLAVSAFGKEKIEEVIETIGMKDTSYSENETTPRDIGLFFQKLWKAEIVSEQDRDEILSFLTDTIYEDWLKKGIPEVRVAHKYGREMHIIHDAGVVFAQKPFVLVIMSEGVVDKEADEQIPEIASVVFDELK